MFIFLQRATGTRWRSALVASLFALHPLHVESVAWIAERKDVLSACFWFLTLWAYVRYSERRSVGRYLAVALSLCLGLMAKPMLVTVPFVLLLLDYWPLARFRQTWRKAIWEKLPLLGLSVADAAITYLVQKHAGAVKVVPLAARLENAARSYAIYFLKTFWPSGLTVYYPFPREFPILQILGAGILLASITAGVIVLRRRAPYLLTGWGWFVVTLVPVIGLVASGLQAYQAHYMYIPMVGLLIMVVWGVAEILERLHSKMLAVPLAATACVACAVLSWIQIGYWRNSETLFRHALEVTDENWVANHNLGNYLMSSPGRLSEAIPYLETAVRINPDATDAQNDLGIALAQSGRLPDAIAQFQLLVHMAPYAPNPHNDLGGALAQAGDYADAIAEFRTALRLYPAFDEARRNLALALLNTGDFSGATVELESFLRTNPNDAHAHNDLGIALAQTGHLPDAIAQFEAAVRLSPDFAGAQLNLGMALSSIPDRLPDALNHLEEADRLRPNPELERTIAHLRSGSEGLAGQP
ncbi:MAG: tetratricopeptide repeat protein [Terracidiphilus sp.]|nr:tetratricopeptide repeat protein [Terracidiphilus sp.]